MDNLKKDPKVSRPIILHRNTKLSGVDLSHFESLGYSPEMLAPFASELFQYYLMVHYVEEDDNTKYYFVKMIIDPVSKGVRPIYEVKKFEITDTKGLFEFSSLPRRIMKDKEVDVLLFSNENADPESVTKILNQWMAMT